MSTTIDALRNLGLKVNGTEPVSNYTGNIINEIADNYTGGGSGSGVYTFDFSGATSSGDYTWTLPINLATMQELLEQPVIDLTLGTAVSNVLETEHITVTKGTSDCFTGSAILADGYIIVIYFSLSSSVAILDYNFQEIPQSSGSGGTQLYKHTIIVNDGDQDQYIVLVHLNSTAATTASECIDLTSPSGYGDTPSWLNNIILGPGWHFMGFSNPTSGTSGKLNIDILMIDPSDQTISATAMECTFVSDTVTSI